jgi:hypothetical protein
MADLIAELEGVARLAEKATPSPWRVEPAWPERCGGDVSITNREHMGDDWDVCTVHSTEANALLIPAAVNFLRAHHAEIAAAVRSLQRVKAMRDEWERDVQEHLCRFGQPLPASVECLIEKLDTAMRAGEVEG